MIKPITQNTTKPSFCGTTIIKKPFFKLDKKMTEAVDMSTQGYYNGNVDGHTVVIVANERYAKEEAEFLKALRSENPHNISFVNFFQVLDCKGKFGKEVNIHTIIENLKKIGVL